jgi:hypothetical protein
MAQTPKVLSQKRRDETLLCIIYHAKVNIAQGDVGILSRITNLSGNSSVTPTTAKILAWEFNGDDDVGMAEWLTKFGGMDNDMAEWRKAERHYGVEWSNGRIVEWRNGGMAGEIAGRPEWLPTYFIYGTHRHRHRH